MKLTIVGAGPGAPELLTGEAMAKIQAAGRVYSTAPRLGDSLYMVRKNISNVPYSMLASVLKEEGGDSAVLLVSGDTGFYSVSTLLRDQLPGWELEWVNGLSSLQYLCARLGVPYQGIKTVSVHGRRVPAVPPVCYNRRTFFLTGGERKAHDVIRELVAAGLGTVRVAVGENLSAPEERLFFGSASELQETVFGGLAVMLAENPAFTDPSAVLRDDAFIRGKTPMTKEEVRAVSLMRLDIRPGDICYDVGAGTGSVAAAMAYLANESLVYAVERDAGALSLLEENRRRLGAFNIVPVAGAAPDALSQLPAPDKVFIGGSGGKLEAVLRAVLEKNRSARVVVNAVTLETLQEAMAVMTRFGLCPEAVCVSCARAETVGKYHMMKAQNPVYVIGGWFRE